MTLPPASTDARRPLVLASRSPRRRQLLSAAGIDHIPVETGIDDAELSRGDVTPSQWAAALAYLTARAGAEAPGEGGTGASRDYTVLGADTICVKDREIIGQPADAADARRILLLLEDAEHEVITGVALVSPARRRIGADRARVRVGRIGRDRLEQFVASGRWRGKAGAYNLAERLDAGWPIEYEGDPTTIMGLPMRLLTRLLSAPGVPVPAPAASPAAPARPTTR